MSIYATTFTLGDEHGHQCPRMSQSEDGIFEEDTAQPCTCASTPLRYQGSHVLPSDSDERGGSLGLAAIPSHIRRDGRVDIPGKDRWYPWLRIDIDDRGTGACVLTRDQVQDLRDALSTWLATTAE